MRFAVCAHFCNCCIFGDFARAGQHRSCDPTPRTRCCSDAGTAFPGGIIAIALLLYAPEAPAWSAELGVELSAEAATSVLPASSITTEDPLFFLDGVPWKEGLYLGDTVPKLLKRRLGGGSRA